MLETPLSVPVLAIIEDGVRLICAACAEQHAHESQLPHLYWSTVGLQAVSRHTMCAKCRCPMDSYEALDAADRISEQLECGTLG